MKARQRTEREGNKIPRIIVTVVQGISTNVTNPCHLTKMVSNVGTCAIVLVFPRVQSVVIVVAPRHSRNPLPNAVLEPAPREKRFTVRITGRRLGRWLWLRFRLTGTAFGRNSEAVRANSSTPWCTTDNLGVLTQSPLREPFPDITEVLAAGQNLVSLDDRSSGIKEARRAGLHLHSIYHEL
jgi:hypothetical protein